MMKRPRTRSVAFGRTVSRLGGYGDRRAGRESSLRGGRITRSRRQCGGMCVHLASVGLEPHPEATFAGARLTKLDDSQGLSLGRHSSGHRETTSAESSDRTAEFHRDAWKAGSHQPEQWGLTFRLPTDPVMDEPLARITSANGLRCLIPVWNSKPPAARRTRHRVPTAFPWCPGPNCRPDNPGDRVVEAVPKANTRAQLHVVAACCDVGAERSPKITPPVWEKTLGSFRDAFNAELGWRRPDDPERASVLQLIHPAHVEATLPRSSLRVESAASERIRRCLLERVEHRNVRNWAKVMAILRDAGLEVPRQGRDYLTALDSETGYWWWTSARPYTDDCNRQRLDTATLEAAGRLAQGDCGVDRKRLRADRRGLASPRAGRGKYKRARFGGRGCVAALGADQRLLPTLAGSPEPVIGYRRRRFGDDALVVDAHLGLDREGQRTRCVDQGRLVYSVSVDCRHSGDLPSKHTGLAVRRAPGRIPAPYLVDLTLSAFREPVERVGELYDRIGKAVHGGREEIVRTGREETAACRAAERACHIPDQAKPDAGRDISMTLGRVGSLSGSAMNVRAGVGDLMSFPSTNAARTSSCADGGDG